jgi:hypothetical protein
MYGFGAGTLVKLPAIWLFTKRRMERVSGAWMRLFPKLF